MLKTGGKPLILLTNDDGIEAPGLKDLHDGLKGLGRVWVVAPAVNQSASSHSFSLRKPIKVWRLRPRWLAVHGTPTDCLLISHHGILKREIDLVFSGINDSPNLGDDVLYSGTVAAAIEGTMLGMPSVVNIPAAEIKGVKVTRLGKRIYKDMAIEGTLPDGGISWTIDGEMAFAETEGSDFAAVYSGYISVTPLHLDMTDHAEIERLQPAFGKLALL
jgi:5'-nucleotidase